MKGHPSILIRLLAIIIGFILIWFVGPVTFLASTIPGIGLIVWGLVGKFNFLGFKI